MMSRGLAWPLAALLTALPLAATFADGGPAVPVRVGIHEGYSRVAFNFASRTDYHVIQQGQHVVVQFAGNVTIGQANAVPRNVLSITGGAGQAEIVVAAGTTVRDWRLGNLVVIDVMDHDAATGKAATTQSVATQPPPPGKPPLNVAQPAASPTPTAAAPTAGPPPPAQAAEPAQSQPKGEATNPQPEPVQAAAPAQPAPPDPAQASIAQPAPVAGAADTVAQTASGVEPGIIVPGGPQLGVAAFRRGGTALIVFDQPRNIDVSALHDDPLFGAAVVQNLQTATVIRLPLDPTMALSPSRTPDAWRITAVPLEPALRPIQANVSGDRLVLPAAEPGTVVSLTDPDTGATLLVGTQRRNGQGVPALRRAPEFTLLPTWQGVVVEPNVDTVALRPTPQGFVLAGALTLSPPSDVANELARSAGLTRQFDFPSQWPF
jgi:cellulose synthase operon protein C